MLVFASEMWAEAVDLQTLDWVGPLCEP